MQIGGKTRQQALDSLSDMSMGMVAISKDEHEARIARAQAYMQAHQIAAIYINAGSNLTYFTGTKWYASERMVGAILPAHGKLSYIAPAFEEATLRNYMQVEGELHCWHEHESPYQLFIDVLRKTIDTSVTKPRIGICESAAFLSLMVFAN